MWPPAAPNGGRIPGLPPAGGGGGSGHRGPDSHLWGKPITVLFHAISGGVTEDASTVFSQGLPYLVSVESKGEEGPGPARRRFSFEEAARLLSASFPGCHHRGGLAPGLRHCPVYPHRPCGHALSGEKELPAPRCARPGPSQHLVFPIHGRVEHHLSPAGYGHGVGMSQAGANAMAAESKSYQAILAHYYRAQPWRSFSPRAHTTSLPGPPYPGRDADESAWIILGRKASARVPAI